MKKFNRLKLFLIASVLSFLGFQSCNDDDIQPEYGVPVSRITNENQTEISTGTNNNAEMTVQEAEDSKIDKSSL